MGTNDKTVDLKKYHYARLRNMDSKRQRPRSHLKLLLLEITNWGNASIMYKKLGRSKGRNGAGMEIVRLRKKRISPQLLNIFLFGKKSHNLWSHRFQNILGFKDFVNIWYEKTRPEWTKVVKSWHFQKRVSVTYLFITRKVFYISSFGKLSHNLWGKAF